MTISVVTHGSLKGALFSFSLSLMIPREYCENELLAEIFGFLPQRYFDELYDYMNAIMHNVIEGVNERLEDMHKDKAIEIFHVIKIIWQSYTN